MEPAPAPSITSVRVLRATVIVWICCLLAGLAAIARWENRPGSWSASPADWPASSSLARADRGFTLLIFVHPHCPCTRASLEELERIVSRTRERLDSTVVFCKPEGAPADWELSDSWQRAKTIPYVSVRCDPDGADARRFGVETSGAVLLFDSRGRLLFHGGITGSRGHEGDNAGESAVLALVDGRQGDSSSPVFGCALFDSDSPDAKAVQQ
jgi:hypothetical protein